MMFKKKIEEERMDYSTNYPVLPKDIFWESELGERPHVSLLWPS